MNRHAAHPSTFARPDRRGVIEARQGSFVFPDTNAQGKGEDPQWVYSVVFKGTELWGADSDPGSSVAIDLWEPYLEPA